jgi:hypothetical protein
MTFFVKLASYARYFVSARLRTARFENGCQVWKLIKNFNAIDGIKALSLAS